MYLYSLAQWLVFLYIYCFLGWCFESAYVSIRQRRLVNRGFLRGPMLPIYGTGAISILFATLPVRGNPVLIYLLGMLAATLLEYATGVVMEWLFKVRYWDYSSQRFQLNGHICLSSSIAWGFLSLLLVLFIHAPIERFVFSMNSQLTAALAFGLSCFFVHDVYHSMRRAVNLRRLLEQNVALHREIDLLREQIEGLREEKRRFESDAREKTDKTVRNMREAMSTARTRRQATLAEIQEALANLGAASIDKLPDGVAEELRGAYAAVSSKVDAWRREARSESTAFIANHPSIRSVQYTEALAALRGAVRPDEHVIEEQEIEENRFAQGTNFYKVFWIFLIASIIGCVVETLFCLATRGHYENRVGMILGPISPVYGIGAVSLTLGLYAKRFQKDSVIFLSGAFIGTVVEYFCSFAQEAALGSTSWDYSAYPLNINGRVCLLYSIFWGLLSVVWMRSFFPMMNRFILRHIPQRMGKAITWLLLLLLTVDAMMTLFAVLRWEERMTEQSAPGTKLEAFCDQYLGDETMTWLFPNMEFTVSEP